MATLTGCQNCMNIKFGVLDMEMWILPTSLNKIIKLNTAMNT